MYITSVSDGLSYFFLVIVRVRFSLLTVSLAWR